MKSINLAELPGVWKYLTNFLGVAVVSPVADNTKKIITLPNFTVSTILYVITKPCHIICESCFVGNLFINVSQFNVFLILSFFLFVLQLLCMRYQFSFLYFYMFELNKHR